MDDCQPDDHFYNMEDCFWRNETEHRTFIHMKTLGYVDLICCLSMLISNAIIIMVFSRKSETSSAINRIFTHISITESLAGLSYAPRAWHEFFRVEECAIQLYRTYFWEELSIISYITAYLFRTVGVWLAMMLAIWRYIAVIHPLKERRWCNPELTSKFITLGYVLAVIVTIPLCFAVKVGNVEKLLDRNGCPTTNTSTGNKTLIYEFQVPLENHPELFILAIIFYGGILKLLPSIGLTFISYRLIVCLLKAKNKRESMLSVRQHSNHRTTIGLLIILALFAIGEVPHGIFCMLTVYYGPPFYWRNYHYAMEINNAVTHVSESFNFIIYYVMSQQFRKTFKELIRCKTIDSRSERVSGQNDTYYCETKL